MKARAPEILQTDTAELFQVAVKRSAALLRAGELVALPTETVYGLAADARNAIAVEGIFAVKGRPSRNPIIVHVADMAMARRCVQHWPPLADRLARAFWPGPLTLVLPKAAWIPAVVTAGGPTVGIRWPSHPFICAVIRECGFPLAAPSANLSNRLSPTSAEHVREGLGTRLRLIVDGGPAQVGIESTVLDLTTQPPRVLRPGMIHEESLRAVTEGSTGLRGTPDDHDHGTRALRSPGCLPKHYAPRAPLRLLSWDTREELISQLAARGMDSSRCHILAHTRIPGAAGLLGVTVVPHDAEAYARALYAELHRCDASGAQWIVVETPPQTAEWRAITDRLERAARPESQAR